MYFLQIAGLSVKQVKTISQLFKLINSLKNNAYYSYLSAILN